MRQSSRVRAFRLASLPLLLLAAPAFADTYVVDSQSTLVLTGLNLSNTSGPCLWIKNSKNVRIVNSTIGPCGNSGVRISNSDSVSVESSYIHDTGTTSSSSDANDFDIWYSTNISLTGNRIERAKAGIYVLQSSGIKVLQNSFLNITGPAFPRGQFVQFNRVSGTGNRIMCNSVENQAGQSSSEEAINMWDTYGDPSDPILIQGNKIKGGGPSTSSGGIMLGDGGGAYVVATDNILVDPGQQGIAVASGHDITVRNNFVYGRQQSFTNVGMYVWNQYSTPCYGITVQNNQVNFTNSNGISNGWWNPGTCGAIAGESTNNFQASITSDIYNQNIAACPNGVGAASSTGSASGTSGTTSGTYYVSDLAYTATANGWGPVERDMSNGEMAAGDGSAISLRGAKYSKGLGVHAYSEVHYAMGSTCTNFTSDVGVDDEENGRGSIDFQVVADGVVLYDSGVVYGYSPAKTVSVDVSGKSDLALIVGNGGDGGNSDHGDWAGARLTCSTVKLR